MEKWLKGVVLFLSIVIRILFRIEPASYGKNKYI